MIKPKSPGHYIRLGRINASLSQAKLGLALGVSSQAVSQWESGRRALPRDRIAHVCTFLRLDPKVLRKLMAREWWKRLKS